MKKLIIAMGLSALIVSFPMCADSADTATISQGVISTSFSTEKEVSPDTVEVSIAIKTEDKKTMNAAVTKNKEISNKVYDYLKQNIITANGDYIKTSNYSANPVYGYNNGKKFLDKYQVSNNIIVHTKSIDKIATYIDKSIELGATDVNSLTFSLSNKDKQCDEMLSAAASKVKGRASSIATAVGSSITGIKTLNTSCSVNQNAMRYGYTRNMLMAKSSMADGVVEEVAPATNIEAGTIKIYSNVDASFYIK